MKWTLNHDSTGWPYLTSGAFTVSKYRIGPETFYEAWRKGTPAVCLGCRLSTSKEARELCERDADEHR